MNNLFKHVGRLAALVTIVAGCIAIYFAFHEKHVKLDVEILNSENLSAHETIQDLSIKYYYMDSIEVQDLWKTQWVIRNTGDKTIIGTGAESQILNDGLPIQFKNSCKVISMRITNSNNGATLKDQRLYFKQWRRDEYVELTAFIDSHCQPDMYINDRDIVDSEVSFSIYTPKREYKNIADYLPIWLNKTLKVLYFIFGAIMILACILGVSTKSNDKATKLAMVLIFGFMLLSIIWIV